MLQFYFLIQSFNSIKICKKIIPTDIYFDYIIVYKSKKKKNNKTTKSFIIFERKLTFYKSSSSSSRAACTDIPDPLAPLFPVVPRLWQVFRATSRILAELLYVCSSWSSCFCSAIGGGPSEYITYELVPASPAVSCMSGSSNLDSFRDGRQVAV